MPGTFDHTHWEKFLKQNNPDSFSYIYKKYVDDLYAYGVSLGFDSDMCKDSIQDVFYKLYSKRTELSHIENLRFYLFRSLRNRLFDLHRQQNKLEPIEWSLNQFPIEVTVLKQIEDEEDNAFLKQKVESLLQLLTSRQREAVYLRYMQNLEYDEIGKMLKMNSESVRKLVYRALEAIRKNTPDTSLSLLTLISLLYS
ncbi:MAG: RNA polymerase sigma factor [Bacteroidia bacterium]|nr:RNA polymerase sigma factor [Bacteroidia bacterium]